jgi:hypothetical protein
MSEVDAVIRTRIATLIATRGLPAAARELKMQPGTLARLAGGAKAHEGSLALAGLRLGLLTLAQPPAIVAQATPTEMIA